MRNKSNGAVAECPVWRHMRGGDEGALAVIFKEHSESLFSFGRKLVRDDDLVKDCVQNLFLKLWSTRHKLMAVSSVRSYLLKSLRHQIADQINADNRKNLLHDEAIPDVQLTFSHEDFLIATQHSQEQTETLAHLLNALPARQREALFLRFYEGLEYAKIGEVMGLNVQSVRNLICQSLKAIKTEINLSAPILVRVAAFRR